MSIDDSRRPADWPADLTALARRTELPPAHRAAAILHSFDVDRRVAESATALSAADLRLLWLLSDGRPRTQREITTELSLDQSTVNRQVNAALRAGHLDRTAADAGPATLSATPEGLQRYQADVETLMDLMGAALQALGDDSDRFLESLGIFVVAYREALADQKR